LAFVELNDYQKKSQKHLATLHLTPVVKVPIQTPLCEVALQVCPTGKKSLNVLMNSVLLKGTMHLLQIQNYIAFSSGVSRSKSLVLVLSVPMPFKIEAKL
jgi:hypothetical protein